MKKELQTKVCEKCGKQFPKLSTTSKKVWQLQRFCSVNCSNTLIKEGHGLPENIKIGMNKHHQERRSQKQNGVLNNNWKGGVSYQFIKKTALIRDDYTCQICGLREPNIMEVDHIKPRAFFPDLAKNINNLLTLCPNCHRRKTNREIKEYAQSVLEQFH